MVAPHDTFPRSSHISHDILPDANAIFAYIVPPRNLRRTMRLSHRAEQRIAADFIQSLLESKRLARDIELKVRYYHIALARETDQIDRARILG